MKLQQVYFGMLDAMLAEEKIPEEYPPNTQDILCNDCEKRGTVSFHWLYHKCPVVVPTTPALSDLDILWVLRGDINTSYSSFSSSLIILQVSLDIFFFAMCPNIDPQIKQLPGMWNFIFLEDACL